VRRRRRRRVFRRKNNLKKRQGKNRKKRKRKEGGCFFGPIHYALFLKFRKHCHAQLNPVFRSFQIF
jgi:hypothetical protein